MASARFHLSEFFTSASRRCCSGMGAASMFALGIALTFFPYRTLTILLQALPWACFAVAALLLLTGVLQRQVGAMRWILAILFAALGTGVLIRPVWGDTILWYLAAFWMLFLGVAMLFLALARSASKGPSLQTERRRWQGTYFLGGALTLAMGILMLYQPRSGLAEALEWFGVEQLALGVLMLCAPIQSQK